MDIVNLDEENIEMYTDYLTPDVAENVGRTFYRGLIVEDNDSPVAGMVWDVKNMMRDDDVEIHISFLRIDDEEATEPLFEEYKTSVMEDGVVRSCFSLPARMGQTAARIPPRTLRRPPLRNWCPKWRRRPNRRSPTTSPNVISTARTS